MARAPKKCPECPPCEQKAAPAAPTERPDVSIIKGPTFTVKEGRKESVFDREAREKIESGEIEVQPTYGPVYPYKPGKDRFSFPEFGYYRKAKTKVCDTGPNKATVTMVTDAEAKEAGILPGPALRLCFEAKKPGVLIPVGTPDDANTVTRKFLDCVRDPKSESRGDAKACALKLSGPGQVVLGKAPRRRKKASP